MSVLSNQPGVQFYTSNYMPDPDNIVSIPIKVISYFVIAINALKIFPVKTAKFDKSPNTGPPIKGKNGALYYKHGAFCLETQKYPDSVNQVRC